MCLKHNTFVIRESLGRNDETGSVRICEIAGSKDDDLRPFNKERWEADALLIAAAPDLLASLKQMTSLFKSALLCTSVKIAREGRPFIDEAEAIIRKATS